MEKKQCARCKATNKAFIINSTRINTKGEKVISYYCRECTRNRYKSWYHRNKEKARAIIYKNNTLHKEKIAARAVLNYAVGAGKITKPLVCEKCSEEATLQAHHSDYTKPLLVMWLCQDCHAAEHRR